MEQSREFVADVMGDDRLQREGGTALLNTVSHAVTPSMLRCVGVGLVGISAAIVRVVLSPY